MIAPEDRVTLPPGVSLDGDVVADSIRGLRIPASRTAALVLAHADGRSIADLGELLSRHGATDGQRDALEFCAQLSRRLLLNVHIRPAALARRRLAAARRGVVLHAPPRRVRSLVPGLAAIGCVVAAAAAPFALLLGAWPVVVGLAFGIVLHEAAHAVALHGVPRALVLRGLRPSLLHPRVGAARAFAVAAAGPLAPALGGLAVIVFWRASAQACAPLAAHALGLTVLAPDGRNACGLS